MLKREELGAGRDNCPDCNTAFSVSPKFLEKIRESEKEAKTAEQERAAAVARETELREREAAEEKIKEEEQREQALAIADQEKRIEAAAQQQRFEQARKSAIAEDHAKHKNLVELARVSRERALKTSYQLYPALDVYLELTTIIIWMGVLFGGFACLLLFGSRQTTIALLASAGVVLTAVSLFASQQLLRVFLSQEQASREAAGLVAGMLLLQNAKSDESADA